MLSRSELAKLIDGPALDREVERLSKKGGGWVEAASVLSRRVNWTLDWADLGPTGSRFRVISSRGEAVIFDDLLDPTRVVKLRGLEQNGYGSAGFGCILGRNARGLVDYLPGSLGQAIEREALCWEHLGFGHSVEAVIEDGIGLLLAQDFIAGVAPSEREIHDCMIEHGWEWQGENREVSPILRNTAWRKGGIGAFDANTTNFVKAEADGKLYPIDLIVWHWPS